MAVLPGYTSFADKPSDAGKSNAKVTIPANAVKIAPGIYKLATVFSEGKLVEGIMAFHHKEGHSGGPGGGGDNGDTESPCFEYLVKNTKWKTAEPWVVNPSPSPSNTNPLDETFVFNNLVADIEEWEDAGGLTEGSPENILGDGSTTTSTLVADTSSPDGVNEVYFAEIDSEGAIAVTIVWYTIGPPWLRQLIEWDQVYDDVRFDWSSIGEADKMDFENIAQHELGHSVGMGHPDDSCIEETMYRFASDGETKKRDLNTGDITGVDKLY